MGAALKSGASKGAYTLTDRGTWLSFKNKQGLKLLVEGDKRLFNPHGITFANPARLKHIKTKEEQIFIDWILSPEGQSAITSF